MAVPKQVFLSWSAGKDSAWALKTLMETPEVEVVGLVTTYSEPLDRVSMHRLRLDLVRRQAEILGLELIEVALPSPCPNEVFQDTFRRLLEVLAARGIDSVAYGDIHLPDVRAYRERLYAGSHVTPIFPLWGLPTRELAEAMIASGMRAHICAIESKFIPSDLLGARFDHAFLDALPEGVDPCGENGEFHTFCSGGPMFPKPIPIRFGSIIHREGFDFIDILLDEARDDDD